MSPLTYTKPLNILLILNEIDLITQEYKKICGKLKQ